MPDDVPSLNWYSVRCVFRLLNNDDAYEERITTWQSASHDEAIELAEAEAAAYADHGTHEYLGLAQSFWLFDPPASGNEVFSLIRESDLGPTEYLNQFFDTGRELQPRNRG